MIRILKHVGIFGQTKHADENDEIFKQGKFGAIQYNNHKSSV